MCELSNGNLYTHWSEKSKTNGYDDLMWNIYVEQEIPLKYDFDMGRNTVRSIWVCSNIVEQTDLGHDLHLPLLRIIPSDSIYESHSTHTFVVPHYKKVGPPRIETIKIWLLEEVSVSNFQSYSIAKPFTFNQHERSEFVPLVINGDVIARLEFIKNA